ncbi:MAG TPA: hypothetical protein VFA41_10690 [Ktedonobacteraceae bacterium]|jgi:hypothetical protein|nr:hypothetical protein [Ktedonobacteraceae bacterium]
MNANTPGTNDALLHELVLRLSVFPGDPRVSNPQLLVGRLPGNVDIPLPEGCRVLGSLMRSQELVNIVLDSTLTPEAVLQFYKEKLTAAGWKEQETLRPMRGGFTHSNAVMFENRMVYCKGVQGPAFTVNAFEGSNGITDVRLEYNSSSEFSPCGQQNRMRQRMMHHTIQNLIPPLLPPKGARQFASGGGGGMDSWHSSATLVADIELPELATHYTTQLAKGGWRLTGEGHDGPIAWSTWTFSDEESEPWRGLFFILKVPGKERSYILEARINWEKKEEEGGGMRIMGGGGLSWS